MGDFGRSILASFFGSVLFALVVTATVLYLTHRRRTKRLEFFGMTLNKTLEVYLPTFTVARGTQDPRGGLIARELELVPRVELLSYLMLRELVELNTLERFAAEHLAAFGWPSSQPLLRPIQAASKFSPEHFTNLFSGSSVVLGGPSLNSAAVHVLAHFNSTYSFAQEDSQWGIVEIQPNGAAVPIASQKPEVHDYEHALLLKFRQQDGCVVFLVAGLYGPGTEFAAQYLALHWVELRKKFGNDEFACWLTFSAPFNSTPVCKPAERPRWR